MKLLQWFLGVGLAGIVMVIIGVIDNRDGLTIGGSIIVGSAAISLAILAAAKK